LIRPFPPARKLVIAAQRSGRRMLPMHGLVDLDVTAARRRLGAHQPLTRNHNVVDGGPAARFGAALRRMVETAEGLGSA